MTPVTLMGDGSYLVRFTNGEIRWYVWGRWLGTVRSKPRARRRNRKRFL